MTTPSLIAPKKVVLVPKCVWSERHSGKAEAHRFATDSRNHWFDKGFDFSKLSEDDRRCVNPECTRAVTEQNSRYESIYIPTDQGGVIMFGALCCESRPECCTSAKAIVASKATGLFGRIEATGEACALCRKFVEEGKTECCPLCKGRYYCSERCRFMHINDHRAECQRILAESDAK